MDTHCAAASQLIQAQEESSNHHGLSKKAQKRAARATRLRELKLERRAREKETKKLRRRERALAIANGEPEGISSRKRRRTADPEIFNARVVVDLGFDELMSDKEINSLTSQLAYTYGANRHAAHTFSVLLFTSLNGKTKQKLDGMNDASYRRWSRTEWWEEGYDRLWTTGQPPQSPTEEMNTQGSPAPADRKNIVYLTADSSEELLELNEGETYIIGGICDHNRYKNLCLNKAIDSQIRHARLPIGRYISLATRKVLTVNQVCFPIYACGVTGRMKYPNLSLKQGVFEILLKWVETRDWEESFWAVIPKRKFQGAAKDGTMIDEGGHGGETDDEETEPRIEGSEVSGEEEDPVHLEGK